jgi:hypothetical protein
MPLRRRFPRLSRVAAAVPQQTAIPSRNQPWTFHRSPTAVVHSRSGQTARAPLDGVIIFEFENSSPLRSSHFAVASCRVA